MAEDVGRAETVGIYTYTLGKKTHKIRYTAPLEKDHMPPSVTVVYLKVFSRIRYVKTDAPKPTLWPFFVVVLFVLFIVLALFSDLMHT